MRVTIKSSWLCLLFLGVLAFVLSASAQTTRPAFIVGVFQQPAEQFEKWRLRGINTIVNPVYGPDQIYGTEQGVVAAAHAAGLWTIGGPACDDLNLPDEADGKGIEPSAIVAQSKAWQDRNPSKQVWLNLDGRRSPWTAPATYSAYAAACQWIGVDQYPICTGEADNHLQLIGDSLTKLRSAAPGQRLFFVVACCDQQLGKSDWLRGTPQGLLARGPTPAELRAEVDLAIKRGCEAVIYFPHVIGQGWISFDGTTPELSDTMVAINATLCPPAKPIAVVVRPRPPPTMPATQASTHQVVIDGVPYVPSK